VTTGPILLTGLAVCATCNGGMTLRTGTSKTGAIHRYYACSICARKGKTVCKGRSIPMAKLDTLVTTSLTEQPFQPEHLAMILSSLPSRRSEKADAVNARVIALQREVNHLGQSCVGDVDAKDERCGIELLQLRNWKLRFQPIAQCLDDLLLTIDERECGGLLRAGDGVDEGRRSVGACDCLHDLTPSQRSTAPDHARYHESIHNLTPAGIYFGRAETFLAERHASSEQPSQTAACSTDCRPLKL
jgi:hypothetical protein